MGLWSDREAAILSLCGSVALWHEVPAAQRRLIVVRALRRSFGQPDLLARQLLVRDQAQEVADAVQPRPLLVITPKDIPRRVLAVRGLKHHVPGARVIVPTSTRGQVHRAQLPL